MAVTKQIEFLSFNKKENPELIKKLNAIAPYEYITVHALAQKLMLQQLDKLISQYGIVLDSTQSAAVVV